MLAQTVSIGVLSFRPVDQNQKIWAPLAKQLHRLEPRYDFNISSHPQDELDANFCLIRTPFRKTSGHYNGLYSDTISELTRTLFTKNRNVSFV
jgi:hypothetical protein